MSLDDVQCINHWKWALNDVQCKIHGEGAGFHDDVIKWKHFLCYWPFVRGIHQSAVNSPHKGQWRRALMLSLISVSIDVWVNNREAGDLRHYRAHYDVTVMFDSDVEYCIARTIRLVVFVALIGKYWFKCICNSCYFLEPIHWWKCKHLWKLCQAVWYYCTLIALLLSADLFDTSGQSFTRTCVFFGFRFTCS